MEYRVVEVRVRQLPTVKVPDDLGLQIASAATDGWEIDRVVPIMSKGFIGGSYTDSLLVFLKRNPGSGRMPNTTQQPTGASSAAPAAERAL